MRLLLFVFMTTTIGNLDLSGGNRYEIDLRVPEKEILRGHLDLGGVGPNGDSWEATSFFIERNGEPYIPVVGEFHFSRFPAEQWEESLWKMKAGGINTAATYVFWNLHEREEGTFDFEGNLNLRHFVELCGQVGLDVIVRVGPFCHGEIRNGGLPDWLYGRTFEVRSNDQGYLDYVDRLYSKIGEQIAGLYFADGGPIIGIQLENEYQHSMAPWELTYPGAVREWTVANLNQSVSFSQISDTSGENPYAEYGQEHMRLLKEMAQKHGMKVPFYTATGWGNAAIVEGGSLPVSAGYAYPFWTETKPSPFFLYKDIHADPDYSPVSYDPERYPSMAAEIGPGIMPLHKRRPYYEEASLAPMMVRMLGSGSNGIGYYMFHGGSTPVFGHFYSEESSGMPKINYDFQAPVGEYGQVRSHFQSVKLLHYFLDSFGSDLAPMQTVLPVTNAGIEATTTDVLRYAVRAKGDSGFVFLHNFQDHLESRDLEDLAIELRTETSTVRLPRKGSFALKEKSWAIFPFNFDLGGVSLRSATAQALLTLKGDPEDRYVFVSMEGVRPEFVFGGEVEVSGDSVTVDRMDDAAIVSGPSGELFEFVVDGRSVLVVPYEKALQLYRLDEAHIAFSDALVVARDGGIECVSSGRKDIDLSIYPRRAEALLVEGARVLPGEAVLPSMGRYRLVVPESEPAVSIERIAKGRYLVTFGDSGLSACSDIFLTIDYVGDRGGAFIDGKLVADHLYHAKPWEISLRRFAEQLREGRGMVLLFHALHRDAEFLEEFSPSHRPVFDEGQKEILEVKDISLVPEYRVRCSW